MANTLAELQQLQALPLDIKIRKTEQRIKEWVDYYGVDGVAVSFSGGKDSTVLMDIARRLYPSIKAVFVDISTQYPELKQFVQTYDNVDIIRPDKNFFQVCEKYGFPLISKEVSESVQGARKYLTELLSSERVLTDRQTDRQTDSCRISISTNELQERENTVNFRKPSLLLTKYQKKILVGGTIENIAECEELANLLNYKMKHRLGGNNQRLANMLGWRTKDNQNPVQMNVGEGERSNFTLEKYKFFLDCPFEISNKCCNEMKKKPLHDYEKLTKRYSITAQMASESKLRTQKWLKNGCNAFDNKHPISNPMSFWTEQDVLLYIKTNNLPICSVYGDVVTDDEETGQLDMGKLLGMELFDLERTPLHTTGCTRTGCVLCGFGAHLEKYPDQRFVNLKETHPQMYRMLDVCKNNGVTYREAIDWVNEHGNLRNRIEY